MVKPPAGEEGDVRVTPGFNRLWRLTGASVIDVSSRGAGRVAHVAC